MVIDNAIALLITSYQITKLPVSAQQAEQIRRYLAAPVRLGAPHPHALLQQLVDALLCRHSVCVCVAITCLALPCLDSNLSI